MKTDFQTFDISCFCAAEDTLYFGINGNEIISLGLSGKRSDICEIKDVSTLVKLGASNGVIYWLGNGFNNKDVPISFSADESGMRRCQKSGLNECLRQCFLLNMYLRTEQK